MKKARQYSLVLKELEDTLAKMNRGEVPIDELEETVRQAAEKIRYLRSILCSTQTMVTKILKEVEEESLEENR
ncbi:MAG: exodeoxyribonuclease VII small subunit [Desulfomonilia bacterium]|jgi:exonuclease VII small subunit|nr:exodeoxyribonuclease VII small subunit [Deltaproteobacteria bacterium]MDX9760439.1 exodeoxyribonuclease VII small subunit [Desulfomonilia bacterium]HPW68323.1 exodeoxyribonuclease VII small subunit [Deltaproteobacteria bacterium]